MSLNNLKNELESSLLITKWSPTDSQLSIIAKRLKDFQGTPTRSNISKVVLEVVDSYEAMAFEGVDNSDLTTLLTLATKTSSTND